MIYNDISSSNIQLHLCTVERVYNSGLVDARSTRDKFFEQINHATAGAEVNYTVGCRCLVISDGTQHFALGEIIEPRVDDNGSTTVKNLNNDLSDLTNAKALVATDGFGSQAKVVVAPGGGVILDSGENAVMHLDPGNNQISELADRKETHTVPFTADLDHNGVTASSKYKWRTTADQLSWDRDVAKDRNDALDIGGILTAEVGPAPNVLSVQYKQTGGVVATDLEFTELGGLKVRSTAGTIELQTGLDGAPPGGTFSLNALGQYKIGNKTGQDLLGVVDQTLQTLAATQVITIFGPSPLITAPVFGGPILLQLTAIKAP